MRKRRKVPTKEEKLAAAVHDAASALNMAMQLAAREGLRVEVTVRRPDRLLRRIFIDCTVSIELGPTKDPAQGDDF
jgi:hypothetical protein